MADAVRVSTRCVKKNPLLQRLQFAVEIFHPGRANLSRLQIQERLAQRYEAEKDATVVWGLRTQFGGGRTTGFGCVYDTLAAFKQFEKKYRQQRNGLIKIEKSSRKLRKERKNKAKKVRGHAKLKITAGKK